MKLIEINIPPIGEGLPPTHICFTGLENRMLSIFWEASENMVQVDFLNVEAYKWSLRNQTSTLEENLEDDLPRLWRIEDSSWLSAWATHDQVDPWIPVCANLKHLRFSGARWQLDCLACEYEIPVCNPI